MSTNADQLKVSLTPAARQALENITALTYGTQDADFAVSRGLVAYWEIMRTQHEGRELRSREVGARGRTRDWRLPRPGDMPKPYTRSGSSEG